ncbi:hypothetical protein CUMW_269910, partial [Citrus unshiu]
MERVHSLRMMSRFLLLHSLILISLFIAAATANTSSTITDRDALLALKAHITHDPTNFLAKNWNTSIPVCNWTGVACDVHSHRVTVLNISSLNLTGTIPSQLGNLSSLQSLNLSFNLLSGSIPSAIFTTYTLKYISLRENQLSGQIPANICSNLPFLEFLSLSQNMLYGGIPSALSKCTYLQALALAYNNFSGTIPIEIGNLTKLKGLYLGANRLQGEIPREFGNLTELELMSLSENELQGEIPLEIGNLQNLEELDLGQNKLIDNPLDGILPKTSVSNLSHSLEKFLMHNCNVSGAIPEEIANLTNLTIVDLGGNKLNGSIPITLGKLRKLQWLSLEDNKLKGSIPDDICRLAKLYRLELGGNKLYGSIPACFGNLASLRILSLGSNKLTFIPLTIWNLKDILQLNFSSNFLTGPLPIEIGNLKVLIGIDFSMNNFSGVIPTEIGGLKNLEYLFLGYNRLQGSIPDSFGDLISLKFLNLSNNNLSGAIPVSLEKLSYLEDLNLSFNKLEGEIPRGGSFGNFSAESFEGNELLCGSPNLQVSPCKTIIHHTSRKNSLLLGIVLPLSTTLLIVVIWLILRYRQRGKQPLNDANMPLVATWRTFSYLELCRATDGFSENNLIGKGGFGSVYKARLGDGMEVAVKVFNLQCKRAFKSFDVECEMMK